MRHQLSNTVFKLLHLKHDVNTENYFLNCSCHKTMIKSANFSFKNKDLK